MSNILSRSNSSAYAQFARYVLVGGGAFAVDYTAMVFCAQIFQIHYLTAATIGFCLGLAANYSISIWWVFDERSLQNRTAEFIVFAAIGITGLGLNDGIIYAGQEWLGVDYRISKLAATGATLVFNFTVRKMILFRRKCG